MGKDTGNDPVDKITRDENARREAILLGLSLGDRALATEKGLMDIGRAVLVKDNRSNNQKKKDEKERGEVLKRAQEALEHQLAELERLLAEIREEIKRLQDENIQIQKDIDKNNEKIDALKEENERIQNLIDRLDNGESEDAIKKGKEYKKAAEEYRRVTGLDPDEIGARGLLIWMKQRNDADISGANDMNDRMREQIESNVARIKELEKRAAEYQTQIDEIKVARESHDSLRQAQLQKETEEKLVETKQKIAELNKESYGSRIVQKFNQRSHAGVSDQEISKDSAFKSQALSSTEREIETFMKELAKAQKIEDATQRLEQEQRLVVALSPEAADELSMGRHTEYLFNESYFKPLAAESATLSKAASTPSANILPG